MDTEIKTYLSWMNGKTVTHLHDICREIGDDVKIIIIDSNGDRVQTDALNPLKIYEPTLVFKDLEAMDKYIKRMEQLF